MVDGNRIFLECKDTGAPIEGQLHADMYTEETGYDKF